MFLSGRICKGRSLREGPLDDLVRQEEGKGKERFISVKSLKKRIHIRLGDGVTRKL